MKRGRLQLGVWFTVFGVGATASAAIVGLALGSIRVPESHASVSAAASAGLTLALIDLTFGKTFTLRRQTCPVWWRTRGPVFAAVAWGVDLGLGFTTIRVTSLYWFVLIVILLRASLVSGALILGLYGVGVMLGLWMGFFALNRRDEIHPNLEALRLRCVMCPVLASSLVVWSFSMLLYQ